MFVPLWLIGLTVLVIVFLAGKALSTSNSGEDMIQRQQRGSPIPPLPPGDEQDLINMPHVRDAMARGHKIEAIKHIRAATGMGLKESKELVERHMQR